ncbi:cation diffusion facilitator family transporter [Microbacterium luteum]|uniref:cation diffusion facilitator family transporter n=1 Tax=Microbacterium TaxID=33882 RepID=UPI001E37DABE|nr:cation transporter [Microbacterium luteum]
MRRFGRTDLPPEQQDALRRAIRWEWITILHMVVAVVLIALVLGGSQALKTAWIEDMLSLIPQITFLIALLLIRKRPSRAYPYGLHRAMGVGHLVAGVTLIGVGGTLAVEAVLGLVRLEHPAIGTVQLFGETIWLGWLMIAVSVLTGIGPIVFARAKLKIAPTLHNKLLYADADMAKADWTTTLSTVIGILGIAFGVWWLDGAAALFISTSIVWDGWRNTRAAVLDLMDQRARTEDDSRVHPLATDVLRTLEGERWVRSAGIRLRDMGQVFHVEAFVVPRRGRADLGDIGRARERVAALDWKMPDVVIVPVDEIPPEAETLATR